MLRMARDKTGTANGLDVQAGSLWPLIDQRRNFALVEVAVNDVHKGYITANGLTTARGIEKYVQQRSIRFPERSIEVKAAWRLFPEATDPRVLARYYTRKAVICVSKEQSRTGQSLKIEGTVGLVAFHIIYKTRSQPHWVWSTFEQ